MQMYSFVHILKCILIHTFFLYNLKVMGYKLRELEALDQGVDV
jgi:hypothetical protein